MSCSEPRLKGMSLADVPNGVSLLAVAVFRLSRSLKSAVTRVVSQDEAVGLVAWRVLVGLSLVSGATQKELVAFTRTEQAQLSRVLKEMDQRGLIRSAADRDDRRARSFSISDVGRRKFQTLLPDVERLTGAMDAALTADEQRQFLSMCERIADASQQVGKNRSDPMNPDEGSHPTVQMEVIR